MWHLPSAVGSCSGGIILGGLLQLAATECWCGFCATKEGGGGALCVCVTECVYVYVGWGGGVLKSIGEC